MIGCGAIGKKHAHLCSQKGTLLAVCDINSERASLFASNYKARLYCSLQEMLEQEKTAHALVVCTPNGYHAEHAVKGLKAGLHVLCEKPMAIHLNECKLMARTARKYKRQLVVVKQNRYNPPVVAVKNALQKGKLGKIVGIQVNCFWNRDVNYYQGSPWRGTKSLDGGALFTQFSHFIDLLYWLAGELKEVKGYVANKAHGNTIETDDTGVFSFITKAGVPGTLHYTTNAFGQNMEGSVTLFAEKGTIKIGGSYLNSVEYQYPQIICTEKLQKSRDANLYEGYQGSMSNHHLVYRDFIKVVTGKQANFLSGEEAMISIKMIEQFYNAAAKSK